MLSEFYKQERVSLEEAFGKKYPICFLHPAAEYRALVRSCGVIDLTHWHILRVQGKDRASFLNAMLTNDAASLETHRGCHSTMTTVTGKVISELFVFARAREHTVVVPQGDLAETVNVLKKHIINEDVTVDDASHECGILGVEGPKAKEIIHRLLGTGRLPKSPLDGVEREFEDFRVFVTQASVTGESGFHVMVPAGEVLRIRNYLIQAARGSDGLPVGRTAWNIRRVENGLPWYGIDFSGDNFPQEARLGHTVSYTKGCFRGQETLARLGHRDHVNRLLVGFVCEKADPLGDLENDIADMIDHTEQAPEAELSERADRDSKTLDLHRIFPAGAPIYAPGLSKASGDAEAGKPAGSITSSVYSLALRKPLLLGFVRREFLETQAVLSVHTPHGALGVRQIKLPVGAHAKKGENK